MVSAPPSATDSARIDQPVAQPVSPEKQATVTTVIYCYRCGRPRLRDAAFCAACGSGIPAFASDRAGATEPTALPGPVLVQAARGWRAQLIWRSIAARLIVVLAAVLLAFFSYQAGRSDLLAGFGSGDLAARYIQIGNDTPGQPFDVAVDTLSANVTVAPAAQASDQEQCSGGPSISENFESGDFPKDAFVGVANDGQAVVQQGTKHEGKYAALVSSTDSKGSYAYVRFGICPGTALDVSADFWIEREGAGLGNVPLFRIFRQDGSRVMSLYRQNGAGDRLFIQVGNNYSQTIGRLPLHTWSTITLHISYPKGTVRVVELIVDGNLVYNSSR